MYIFTLSRSCCEGGLVVWAVSFGCVVGNDTNTTRRDTI